jgi:LysM repeat protein
MNNPNPFIPQGSLVEQMNKKRARVKMAVLAIFSGTILLIAPVLLIQGCKRDQSAQDTTTTDSTAVADTNTTPTPDATMTSSPTVANTNNVPAAMPAQPVAAMPVAQPVAQPMPATAPEQAASTYVIVPHDTLAAIAKKFNVKLKELMAANPGVVANKLAVGKSLNIPASSSTTASATASTSTDASGEDVYTVKPGDNLTKIAHTSGTTVKALMALNNMTSTRINAGQKLKLPAKTTAASPMDTMPTTMTTASNPTSGASVMH